MEQPKEESGLLTVLMNLIGFIRKYFLILIVGLLAGTGMGIKAYYQSKDYSKAKLVISTSFIDNDVVAKLVNALQLYIENGDRQGLAKKMGTTPDKIGTLSGLLADTTKAKMNAIKVDLSLSDPSMADSVTGALVNYLNNNSFIKDIVDLKARQREFLISENQIRIAEIDSLLQSGRISFSSYKDVAAVNDNYIAMIKEMQEAEFEGAVYKNIRIIEQNVTTVPKRGLKNTLIINIIAYFFLSFALSALIEVLRIYFRREKLKKQQAKSSM